MAHDSQEPTAVYLIRNIWAESTFKIGVASVIDRRRFQIEGQYCVAPVLVGAAWFPNRTFAQTAETKWHRTLHEFQTDDHGGKEWFCLPQKWVKALTSWVNSGPSETAVKLGTKYLSLRSDLDSSSKSLIKSIPKRTRHVPDDLWNNPNYQTNEE